MDKKLGIPKVFVWRPRESYECKTKKIKNEHLDISVNIIHLMGYLFDT